MTMPMKAIRKMLASHLHNQFTDWQLTDPQCEVASCYVRGLSDRYVMDLVQDLEHGFALYWTKRGNKYRVETLYRTD